MAGDALLARAVEGDEQQLAAQIIQATGQGAVTTWHSTPAERRNPALLTVLRESMVAAVTRAEPTVPAAESGPAPAARALRAALPDDADVLSDAEQRLLREWLTRLAADGGTPQVRCSVSCPRTGRGSRAETIHQARSAEMRPWATTRLRLTGVGAGGGIAGR
ncbi:hypothetical protein Srufu_076010 [Streptomyces libani subsp. rufus]|nr:hypothetical protein Srufu_076010 [Streptomyces libani subsp. rufus]